MMNHMATPMPTHTNTPDTLQMPRHTRDPQQMPTQPPLVREIELEKARVPTPACQHLQHSQLHLSAASLSFFSPSSLKSSNKACGSCSGDDKLVNPSLKTVQLVTPRVGDSSDRDSPQSQTGSNRTSPQSQTEASSCKLGKLPVPSVS